jgi:hypothetical protein
MEGTHGWMTPVRNNSIDEFPLGPRCHDYHDDDKNRNNEDNTNRVRRNGVGNCGESATVTTAIDN